MKREELSSGENGNRRAVVIIAAADERLLQLYNARDERALQETASQYGTLCRSAAENILGSPEDAEECFSDMLLKAWNSIPPAAPQNFAAYLLKIIRSIALSRYRQQKSKKRGGRGAAVPLSEMEEFLPADDSVESEADRRALLAAVTRFLQEQTEKKQQLFISRYFKFMGIPEIAAETGMTEAAVYKGLSRIRRKLQDYLRKEGFA